MIQIKDSVSVGWWWWWSARREVGGGNVCSQAVCVCGEKSVQRFNVRCCSAQATCRNFRALSQSDDSQPACGGWIPSARSGYFSAGSR